MNEQNDIKTFDDFVKAVLRLAKNLGSMV